MRDLFSASLIQLALPQCSAPCSMANKAFSKRQKLMIRTQSGEAPGTCKPRNPFAAPAKQRSAGAHRRGMIGARQSLNRLLEKALKDPHD